MKTELIADPQGLAGKHLTFSLGDEHYGLGIMRVQEIIGLTPVTKVPRLPDHVAGVIDLRGRVIPVIDLRQAFGMEKAEATQRTCVIVVRVQRDVGDGTVTGLIVDEVSDVADLTADQIEAVPGFGAGVDTSFLTGVGRIDDRVVMLLDIDRLLSAEQITELEDIA
jgi:purine-binding chemotaxis protein CheW